MGHTVDVRHAMFRRAATSTEKSPEAQALPNGERALHVSQRPYVTNGQGKFSGKSAVVVIRVCGQFNRRALPNCSVGGCDCLSMLKLALGIEVGGRLVGGWLADDDTVVGGDK